ncbi:MAG: 4'-phosphopantetheinyl transferase superfamily protein [Clostridia bacterium]|nr:4'-phosphopantetheinyl transferase superfamily protein [Clostridia bacterium]
MNVTPLSDENTFNFFYKNVSKYRQEKINTFKQRKDKNLSLGAGILLGSALKDLGLIEKNMLYKEGKYGKPYFENEPNLYFSVSHSDNKALVAISDTEIGCDIERIDNIDLSIAKRFFHTDEYNNIVGLHNTAEQQRQFFSFWTLKESFIKATGFGLKLPLDRFCISIDGENISVSCCDTDGIYNFAEYSDIPDFCVAYCINGTVQKTNLECKNDLLLL